jgi:hypothetical protein
MAYGDRVRPWPRAHGEFQAEARPPTAAAKRFRRQPGPRHIPVPGNAPAAFGAHGRVTAHGEFQAQARPPAAAAKRFRRQPGPRHIPVPGNAPAAFGAHGRVTAHGEFQAQARPPAAAAKRFRRRPGPRHIPVPGNAPAAFGAHGRVTAHGDRVRPRPRAHGEFQAEARPPTAPAKRFRRRPGPRHIPVPGNAPATFQARGRVMAYGDRVRPRPRVRGESQADARPPTAAAKRFRRRPGTRHIPVPGNAPAALQARGRVMALHAWSAKAEPAAP